MAGERVTLDAITTVATSLGAKQVCARAFDLLGQYPILPVQVSDAEALDACARFLDDHRTLVEPACGASVALAYGAAEVLAPFRNVLMIVCGGSTMSLAQMQEWQQRPS